MNYLFIQQDGKFYKTFIYKRHAISSIFGGDIHIIMF